MSAEYDDLEYEDPNMEMIEEAIESAARHIKKKETKQHKKHVAGESHNHSKLHRGGGYGKLEQCSCEIVSKEVEEGKRSKVLKSSIIDRTLERRKGVAEHNDTERKLVKESVEVMVKTQNMKDYNMI